MAAGLKQSDVPMATLNGESTQKDVQTATKENEENSGVSCPGTSIEQLIGTIMTIEEKNF